MAVTRTTSYNRALELSRNITSYVFAADVVHLSASDDTRFRSFIFGLRTKALEGHSGGTNLLSTAMVSPTSWGAMSRAVMVAIDLYLGDRNELNRLATAHRAWLGEPVAGRLRYTDTGWHASTTKAGINRRGALVAGRPAGGVQPEEQRRTGEPSARSAPHMARTPGRPSRGRWSPGCSTASPARRSPPPLGRRPARTWRGPTGLTARTPDRQRSGGSGRGFRASVAVEYRLGPPGGRAGTVIAC